MQRGEAAHRQADDVRLVDLQRVEHGANIIARAVLRVALDIVGHVRGRIAAGIESYAAVSAAEISDLSFIGAVVAGEFVHEDDRKA